MKTIKRTTVSVETFESAVIRLGQPPLKFFCADCRKTVSEMPVTKITFVQPVSQTKDIYMFVTDSGVCFFLEII